MLRINLATMARRESFAALLALAIFNVNLLGRAQVFADVHQTQQQTSRAPARDLLLAAAISPETSWTPEPLPFQEAIDFFRDKTSVSPERFRSMTLAARQKAFTIADGANRQVRDSIRGLLDQSLAAGLTLSDFKEQAADVLDNAGLSARQPWYWETVYRTNMATSYQAGRWQQMTDPDVVKVRPYLRYVSALLPTTRPSHREKHGVVLPADDPFWNAWYPPNGFNCYCTVQSVSESLLQRRGWNVGAPAFQYPDPDPGFAGNAGRTESV